MRRLAERSRGAARFDHDADQLTERRLVQQRVDARPGARLRQLLTNPRGAELARPLEQRRVRQVEAHAAATRAQRLPVPGGPERLPAPAPERRPAAEPGRAAADQGAGAEVFPSACAPTASRASPTPTAAAGYPTLPALESIRVRHNSRRQIKHAGGTGPRTSLERRLQLLGPDTWVMSAALVTVAGGYAAGGDRPRCFGSEPERWLRIAPPGVRVTGRQPRVSYNELDRRATSCEGS